MALDEHWTTFEAPARTDGTLANCVKCGSLLVRSVEVVLAQRGFFAIRNVQRDFDYCAGCGRGIGWSGPEPDPASGIVIKRKMPEGGDVVVWPRG